MYLLYGWIFPRCMFNLDPAAFPRFWQLGCLLQGKLKYSVPSANLQCMNLRGPLHTWGTSAHEIQPWTLWSNYIPDNIATGRLDLALSLKLSSIYPHLFTKPVLHWWSVIHFGNPKSTEDVWMTTVWSIWTSPSPPLQSQEHNHPRNRWRTQNSLDDVLL